MCCAGCQNFYIQILVCLQAFNTLDESTLILILCQDKFFLHKNRNVKMGDTLFDVTLASQRRRRQTTTKMRFDNNCRQKKISVSHVIFFKNWWTKLLKHKKLRNVIFSFQITLKWFKTILVVLGSIPKWVKANNNCTECITNLSKSSEKIKIGSLLTTLKSSHMF